MRDEKIFYVYEHWRPDKDVCFYVGKGHKDRAWSLTKRNNWHASVTSKLTALGLCVDVRIVARDLSEQEALDLEVVQIAKYAAGTLVNLTKGGEGVSGLVMSDVAKARMAARKSGVKRGPYSAEHRAKIGANQKGKKLSAEHRVKLSDARKKRIVTQETREKMRASMLAKPREWHVARAMARQNTKRSAETRARISVAAKGKVISNEQRAKISAALRGRKLSAEHVAAIQRGKKRAKEAA